MLKKRKLNKRNLFQGVLAEAGRSMCFPDSDNASYIAVNQIHKTGGKVSSSLEEFTVGGKKYPVGTFIVDSSSIGTNKLKEIAAQTQTKMVAGKISVQNTTSP